MPENVRQVHAGGSFAPPLTDALFASYEKLAKEAGGPVGEAMQSLLKCCRAWWDLPEPEGTKQWAHPSGRGTVVELQGDHAKALDPHIPWKHEIETTARLFDAIDPETQRDLRNAAHHLLWHVVELDLGREPLTKDKL